MALRGALYREIAAFGEILANSRHRRASGDRCGSRFQVIESRDTSAPAMTSTRRPLILFARGAGAPSTSAWMRAWARRLERLGEVVRFDYRYLKEGRRSPDPRPALLAAHRAALDRARAEHSRGPVVLAGKSMGSRVACHLALEAPADVLVCLGYPLVSASGAVRDDVLVALRTPVLFVQGSADRLCPLELLEATRTRMKAPSRVHVVEGGDHSLLVRTRTLSARGSSQAQVDEEILAVIRSFLEEHLPETS
jgi:predicted alpha/beta-hydrolase family hydrolase